MTVQIISLDLIDPSPFQKRAVDQAYVEQVLAPDISAHGLLQNPMARPHPTIPGRFQLAFGQAGRDVLHPVEGRYRPAEDLIRPVAGEPFRAGMPGADAAVEIQPARWPTTGRLSSATRARLSSTAPGPSKRRRGAVLRTSDSQRHPSGSAATQKGTERRKIARLRRGKRVVFAKNSKSSICSKCPRAATRSQINDQAFA